VTTQRRFARLGTGAAPETENTSCRARESWVVAPITVRLPGRGECDCDGRRAGRCADVPRRRAARAGGRCPAVVGRDERVVVTRAGRVARVAGPGIALRLPAWSEPSPYRCARPRCRWSCLRLRGKASRSRRDNRGLRAPRPVRHRPAGRAVRRHRTGRRRRAADTDCQPRPGPAAPAVRPRGGRGRQRAPPRSRVGDSRVSR
jgi:hypothetical protein